MQAAAICRCSRENRQTGFSNIVFWWGPFARDANWWSIL